MLNTLYYLITDCRSSLLGFFVFKVCCDLLNNNSSTSSNINNLVITNNITSTT